MRPDMVVSKGIPFGHLLNPLSHDDLGFSQAVEDLTIQKVVPRGAVKAFTKAILPRAARFNVGCLYSNAR